MKTIRKRIVAIAAICALIMGLSLGGLSYYYSGHMATEDSETLIRLRWNRCLPECRNQPLPWKQS